MAAATTGIATGALRSASVGCDPARLPPLSRRHRNHRHSSPLRHRGRYASEKTRSTLSASEPLPVAERASARTENRNTRSRTHAANRVKGMTAFHDLPIEERRKLLWAYARLDTRIGQQYAHGHHSANTFASVRHRSRLVLRHARLESYILGETDYFDPREQNR